MAVLPTVKVKKGDGFRIINESDFDPAVHELYEEAVPVAEGPGKPKPVKRGRPRKGRAD